MGVPKRKVSRSRRDKRRTHDKLTVPQLTVCGHCGQRKLPHRACPHCGFYGDRRVVAVE